jgi:hypothetical protein
LSQETGRIFGFPFINFWLAPQGQLGTAVINLEGNYNITGFNLVDTHNRGYFDRGTQSFDIAVSSDDVHFTTVLTGAFSSSQWANLTPVTFDLGSAVEGQYVRFNVDSLFGGTSGGLDELNILGSAAVPESGNVAFFLLGLIAVDVALRRRHKCRLTRRTAHGRIALFSTMFI